MEITSMNKSELDALNKQIEERLKKIKQEELRKRGAVAASNVQELRQHKDMLIKLIKHDRTSCSDTKISNGWHSASYGARCNKCLLIEILNCEWDDEMFEVDISVNITEIK